MPHRRVDVVSLVVTNLTPVAGILFLGWPALNLVAIYSVDMALTLYSLTWLVMTHVTEANDPDQSFKHDVKIGLSAFVGGSFLVGVLVTPMLMVFADTGWWRDEGWRDPGFRTAMAIQVVASLYAAVRMHRMLAESVDDDRLLGEEFKFVVARWIVVLAVVFFGVDGILSLRMGGVAVVVLYAGATIWFSLFPEQVNRIFGTKAKPPGGDRIV